MGRLVYSLLEYANLGDSLARGLRRSSGLAWNGLLPFGEYLESLGLLRLSSPRFQNFGFWAHPAFVFHFTATSIPFSYCLTRVRSPVWATVSADSLYLLLCFFAERWSYLMALYWDLSYFSSRFHRLLSPGVGRTWWRYIGACRTSLEILPSTHREVVWSFRSVCRVYLWPESV